MKTPPLDKPARRAALRATIAELSCEPVRHPRFNEALEDLELAAESAAMPLLLGVAGAGKSYLCDYLVRRRCAEPLRALAPTCLDDQPPLPRLVAARVTAPASHRGAFSWKALSKRVLQVLSQPVVDSNFDPDRCAAALRSGKHLPGLKDTEADLFDKVRAAALDRGLELLVIDEACSLTKFDRGRTLADQLDVLRELADLTSFPIVLVSTFRIVEHLQCSSELNRRIVRIVFDRYLDESTLVGREDDYLNFCRVAASLMERVPEWARLRLGALEYRRLYNGEPSAVSACSPTGGVGRLRAAPAAGAPWSGGISSARQSGATSARRWTAMRSSPPPISSPRGTASLDTPPSDLPDPSPPPVCDSPPRPRKRKPSEASPKKSPSAKSRKGSTDTKSSDRLPGGRLRRPPKRLPVPTGADSPPQDEE